MTPELLCAYGADPYDEPLRQSRPVSSANLDRGAGSSAGHLQGHDAVLEDGDLLLRPMTEEDWEVVLVWNQDPEVLWFSEGDDITSRTMADLQAIYRDISATPADMFIFEVAGVPVGDGWVQAMNLVRVTDAFPGVDCRRIDLELGRPWWGQGIGTRAIRALTTHAFARGADLVWGVDIASDNPRSSRAFLANGYVNWRRWPEPPGSKVPFRCDLVCRRDHFEG
jgi:RimJ/RimL family protein N-acetyltransferase